MKSVLHVKNFGPIKDAKLDLRSVNVFIGPQASGKSTLAKIFTICKSPVMYFELEEGRFSPHRKDGGLDLKLKKPSFSKFQESLNFFSLTGYIGSDSEISFVSPTHSIYIKNNELKFEDNLKIDELIEDYEEYELGNLKTSFLSLIKKSTWFDFHLKFNLFWEINKSNIDAETISEEYNEFSKNLKIDNFLNEAYFPIFIDTAIELRSMVFNNDANYIPAERTIVNLIKQASLNFQRSKIPIPGHLLDYAAKYEAATYEITKFDLGFLSKNTEYRNEQGEDRIFFADDRSVRLTDSASGFQSVVPMLLPLQSDPIGLINQQLAFVIEEPETNLFPRAQYEVLKFIERGRKNDFGMIDQGAMHIYTTHSPFVLSSLNNMLFGFKKGILADKLVKRKISNVISEDNWINPDDFSAYEIKNGKVKSIFSRKSGLINETVIDVVSEEIMDDFRKIAVISAEANVEK